MVNNSTNINKTNNNIDLNQQYKPTQIPFKSKRPLTITKMNDNINVDSTIAGSVNAHS